MLYQLSYDPTQNGCNLGSRPALSNLLPVGFNGSGRFSRTVLESQSSSVLPITEKTVRWTTFGRGAGEFGARAQARHYSSPKIFLPWAVIID